MRHLVRVDIVWKLEDFEGAFAQTASGHARGKVVFNIANDWSEIRKYRSFTTCNISYNQHTTVHVLFFWIEPDFSRTDTSCRGS